MGIMQICYKLTWFEQEVRLESLMTLSGSLEVLLLFVKQYILIHLWCTLIFETFTFTNSYIIYYMKNNIPNVRLNGML